MSDYLWSDMKPPCQDHPDSSIRLASVVHRFRVPEPTRRVSFATSFATVGRDTKTRKILNQADDSRQRLTEACDGAIKTSSQRVAKEAARYQPLIHTILLSCKVQPEQARLDEKLLFEWKSGIEKVTVQKKKATATAYQSEAIMYDLVMCVVTQGLAESVAATEQSMNGEFASASRHYAAAAGIFDFLAQDQLPKWISKGSAVDETALPAECHAAMAQGLVKLFQANGQQMAVATLLIKEGTPNYSLLAKLCLGIAEQLEDFIATLRRSAFEQLGRLDSDFLTLVAFQIAVQKSLSLYFQARTKWEQQEHGIAIALMSDAGVALQTRDSTASAGVPDVTRTPALLPLQSELENLRQHQQLLLREWEKDNSSVYFESVPQHVPAGKKLQEGIVMAKKQEFTLDVVEPVLLHLPEGSLQRSDSDLARELQERFNIEGAEA